MQLVPSKPKIDAMLRRLPIDDRIGALIGSFQEASNSDVLAVACKTIGFLAWLAKGRLSASDRNHCAVALVEVARHIIEERRDGLRLT